MAPLAAGSTVREYDLTSSGEFGGLNLTVFPDGRRFGVHHYQEGADHDIEVGTGVVTRTEFTSEDGVRIQRVAP